MVAFICLAYKVAKEAAKPQVLIGRGKN